MRVLELSLRNFRVFEEVDLELPARVIGIFGPNGAGKSTLVESMLFALYGSDAARTKKSQIRTHGMLTDCEVRLAFEHGGRQYEVRRTIKGKGHTPHAELFVGDLQLASGTSEVDSEIRKLLHMDLRVFRASVFAEQKQLDAFSEVAEGKRKEMVLSLLGIRPVDGARSTARRQATQARDDADRLGGTLPDLAGLEGALSEAEESAKEAGERAKAAAEALTHAETRAKGAQEDFERSDAVRERTEKLAVELKALRGQAHQLEQQRDALETRTAARRKAMEDLPRAEKALEEIAGSDETLASGRRVVDSARAVEKLQLELAKLPEVDSEAAEAACTAADARREELRRVAAGAEAELRAATRELASAEEALRRADDADPSQPCPTCGRPLGDDFQGYLKHCAAEVREATRQKRAAEKSARELLAGMREAERICSEATKKRDEARRAADLRGRITDQLRDAAAAFDEHAGPFGGAVPDLPDLEAKARRERELEGLVRELRAARAHLAEEERDLEQRVVSLTECTTRLDLLGREAAELAFDPENHSRLRKERDEALLLAEDARRLEREASNVLHAVQKEVTRLHAEMKSVKAIALQVGEMRDEARYLDRVSLLLKGFRDHLVARIGPELSRQSEELFRELTNNEYEDLRIDDDTLAIEIADAGQYFSIERFSGSETDLANLALRVAISMHLSRVSGADVGMMVLDEVLASLDAERKDLFVQVMGRLSTRFHQLFVITHAEQVKDQFPASIEVTKLGRRRSQATLI